MRLVVSLEKGKHTMKTSTLKKLIGNGSKNCPIIGNILVSNGKAKCTNLDMMLEFNTGVSDGLWPIAKLDCADLPAPDGMFAADFPDVLNIGKPYATMEVNNEFMNALTWCNVASIDEATRYYLCGVHIAANGDIVATDGRRLHLVNMPTLEGKAQGSLIIPSHAVDILELLTKKSDCQMIMTLHDLGVQFVGDGWTLTTKIIDGSFPDYKRVIPDTGSHEKTTIDFQDFEAALKKWKKTGLKAKTVWAKFEEGEIVVRSPDVADISFKMPCSSKPTIVCQFNAKFLADTGMIGDAWLDSSGPSVFKQDDKLAVCMPIRL